MVVHSAGMLPYRYKKECLELFLVHPGGPFWAKKELGSWSIAKGTVEEGEEVLETAKREFLEETGHKIRGNLIELGEIKQPSGKVVHAWASEEIIDPKGITSNTFQLEWPKRSGHIVEFPEVDRAGWFDLKTARKKILKGQIDFIDILIEKLGYHDNDEDENRYEQTHLM